MRIKNIMLLGAVALMSSCSTVRMTSDSVAVDASVSTYPTIADLHIGKQRVSKTTEWKWNPFNTTSLSVRRGNVKAELIKESGADILIEPEFVQRTSWGNLLGGSVTVTGYPATLDNFRKATPEDIEAMRSVGMLKCDEQYILLGQDDANGVIIGKTEAPVAAGVPESPLSPVQPVAADAVGRTATPAGQPENVIPGDRISQPVYSSHASREAMLIPSTSSKPSLTPKTAQTASLTPSTNNVLAFDEIGKTRYLTTMAREYYGNSDFWPYIYEENNFGHPDRIKPGTTVVIPNLKKYGVNPQNPTDVEKARRLGREIYSRYGKKY